mmetsp:Transcript_43763/g.105546  ORF Transcript_43763/g.105546 Transcript_43763/m.105546 type:complete len:365 (+) Transcript_43763:146-1240(+)|eukprot:CAMPEP_0113630572 /NCGR_PEP_ID=MMETSP0017_2-20120614/15885_1 /TAXON_ID=2856 /ORGANISM="Cylindrotheca closterium" /LENGTH=364 /DNA_ID=CAMNT_0000541043 /DNA_START=146 /DNA_END=1240 /DNA_ORIENTATION=+ /assembly_acc=CAM_ASM_000147
MKRATGASFFVTLLVLVLICFLQGEVVGAVDNRPVRSHERTQDTHHGTATRSSITVGENGRQHENTVGRVDYSANHQQQTRSGEKRTAPKIEVTTHTTTAATRTEERSDWNTSHGRTSGNGVAVDDRTERTHHHSGGGTNERTHSDPHTPPTRSSDVVNREEGHSQNRDGTTTTTSHSRTQSNGELYDRHDHTGEERTNAHERPAPKTTPNRPSTEERTGGEEEETAVQAKTEAHPIGLINGLDGKVAKGRSIELDAREMDATTTIIASALIGFVVLMLLLFCIAEIAKKRREKKADSTRLLRVFQYLHEFNVDDIDIQLSAAGGFHVGYLNGLAQGINTKKQSDQKTDTSSDEGESGSLSKKV